MLLKSKYVNGICIALVSTVLALALTAGIFGIIAVLNPDIFDPGDYPSKKKETPVPIIPPIDEDPDVPYTVQGQTDSDAVYLRTDSYGDYDGKEWLEATPYTHLIDSKYPATYLGTKSIESMGDSQAIGLAIIPHVSKIAIPTYSITKRNGSAYTPQYELAKDDVYAAKSTAEFMQKSAQERQYLLYYYDYRDTKIEPSGLSSEYKTYEQTYRTFVYKNYVNIDSSMKEYMLSIAEEQKIDKNSANVADQVCVYVNSVAEYSTEYDENLDKESNVVKAFIEEYKKGSCKHFASTATLMFRALGIPARYVTGFMTETVAGQWIDVTREDAHAWVEIYVDGFGWKMVEATPTQMRFKIKPVDVEKVYDGTPLVAKPEVEDVKTQSEAGDAVAPENSFIAFAEKMGYTYEAVVSGEVAKPGIGESKIESMKVFDATGKDISHLFAFELEPGKMIHYAGDVLLQSEGDEWAYNWGELKSNLDKCSVTFGEADYFSGTCKVEAIEKKIPLKIGKQLHEFDIKITDQDGNDVTDLYKKEYALGYIDIKPPTLIFIATSITAGSQEFVNDGKATTLWNGDTIVATGYTVRGELLEDDDIMPGDGFVVGELSGPGTKTIVFDSSKLVIKNAAGEDVTNNYILSYVEGKLTILG
ncbi:MAG: transglutaminase domain-containing protein [Clostridia bacterium]|nr:transglutaminase domain-containing protein [Clostridia bacterium]